jgi:hypothetical protein
MNWERAESLLLPLASLRPKSKPFGGKIALGSFELRAVTTALGSWRKCADIPSMVHIVISIRGEHEDVVVLGLFSLFFHCAKRSAGFLRTVWIVFLFLYN